jgi:hypothetical protein
MTRKKYSKNDFSKHVIIETINKDVNIREFAIPGKKRYSCTFINCRGVMTVTGDFGNYVFSREFHPSPEGEVCPSYWVEKLRHNSCQKPTVYCPERTEEAIRHFEGEHKGDLVEGEELDIELEEYIERLYDSLYECELDYDSAAYRNMPDNVECEDVPKGFKYVDFLPQVFDAFNAMCEQMEGKQ